MSHCEPVRKCSAFWFSVWDSLWEINLSCGIWGFAFFAQVIGWSEGFFKGFIKLVIFSCW